MTAAGYAYVYTVPYWIFTEDTEKWNGIKVDDKNYLYLVYPPHRHSPYPFLNTPTKMNLEQIPGLRILGNITAEPFNILLPVMGKPLKRNIIWPGGIDKLDPCSIPKDSVRIDMLSKSGYTFEPKDANRFLNNLMQLVRWKTKQWWITRSSYALSKSGAFPIAIDTHHLPVKETIRPLPVITTSGLFGDELNLTEALWEECISHTCLDQEPIPVYELLLLEARYFVGVNEIRQSILEASSAVDFCREITFERLWCAKYPGKIFDDKRRNDLLRNWDYPRHLDVLFNKHFGRSYKLERPQHWSYINCLSKSRNNVAHGKPSEYGDPPVTVDNKLCRQFITASEDCVKWLMSI